MPACRPKNHGLSLFFSLLLLFQRGNRNEAFHWQISIQFTVGQDITPNSPSAKMKPHVKKQFQRCTAMKENLMHLRSDILALLLRFCQKGSKEEQKMLPYILGMRSHWIMPTQHHEHWLNSQEWKNILQYYYRTDFCDSPWFRNWRLHGVYHTPELCYISIEYMYTTATKHFQHTAQR